MTGPNPILDANNAPIKVTTIVQSGTSPGTQSEPWIPLGTAGDSTVGELAVKVKLIGGSAAAPQLSVTVMGQDSVNDPKIIRTDSNGAVLLASQGYSSQVTITRPANTTPYTAGDVLGGALTIATIGPTAGPIILTNFALMPQIAAVPTGMTSFRLNLYSATPPSALADNAVWDLPSGDRASYLGFVDLGLPVDFGSTLFCQVTGVNLQTKLVSGTSLFGYLVTNGGFTPAANSEVYRLDAYAVGV